ncbi:MAG: hypothetical protein ACRDTQ_13330 [Micromonosporaceae bacterium]
MTSKRASYKAVLRALFTRDSEAAQEKSAELGDLTWADSGVLAGAAFVIAMERRFKDDDSHAAIKAFVKEAQENYEDAEPAIKPLQAEALIRGVLGEAELMREVPRDDALPTQLALTYKVLADEQASPEDVDRLLDEAEALAQQWAPSS